MCASCSNKNFWVVMEHYNGIEGFWSFSKERLIKYHGVSPRKFLYYVKEMEWRYNNRKNKNLLDLLLKHLLDDFT